MKLCGAWARLLAMLSLACLLSASISFAQTGTASLYGKVTDQQGAVLPGVTVTVTSTAAAVTRSTVSDGTGSYQFLALPPGTLHHQGRADRVPHRHARQGGAARRHAHQDGRADGDRAQTPRPSRSPPSCSPINTTDASIGNVDQRQPGRERCRSRPATSSGCSACSPAPSTCRTRRTRIRAAARSAAPAPTSRTSRSTAWTSTTRSSAPPTRARCA